MNDLCSHLKSGAFINRELKENFKARMAGLLISGDDDLYLIMNDVLETDALGDTYEGEIEPICDLALQEKGKIFGETEITFEDFFRQDYQLALRLNWLYAKVKGFKQTVIKAMCEPCFDQFRNVMLGKSSSSSSSSSSLFRMFRGA